MRAAPLKEESSGLVWNRMWAGQLGRGHMPRSRYSFICMCVFVQVLHCHHTGKSNPRVHVCLHTADLRRVFSCVCVCVCVCIRACLKYAPSSLKCRLRFPAQRARHPLWQCPQPTLEQAARQSAPLSRPAAPSLSALAASARIKTRRRL